MYLHKNKRYHIQVCSNEVLTIEKKKFLWSLNRQKRQGIVWDSILTVNVSGLYIYKKKKLGEEWVRQPKKYYFWWHGQKKLWMGMLCKKNLFSFLCSKYSSFTYEIKDKNGKASMESHDLESRWRSSACFSTKVSVLAVHWSWWHNPSMIMESTWPYHMESNMSKVWFELWP